RDVMSQFMGAENREHGGAVREALQIERLDDRPDEGEVSCRNARKNLLKPGVSVERGIIQAAEQSCGRNGQEEEANVHTPPVVEPAERRRRRRVNGQPPMFWRSLPGLKRIGR